MKDRTRSIITSVFLVWCAATAKTQESRGPSRESFRWNWRHSQELNAKDSLRNAQLPEDDKRAIADVIEAQFKPSMQDLEIKSEQELKNAALDTKVKMIHLRDDGAPDVVAQGMKDCSPTGNCPLWIFEKDGKGYRLILKCHGQAFTIQPTKTNGYHDIVVATHGSATQSGLKEYRYEGGLYRDVGCYNAEWQVLEGKELRELKEPQVTPCL